MLRDGQSDVSSVSVRLPDLGIEVKTWDGYSMRDDFMNPCAAFDFALSTNNPSTYAELFTVGTKVEIAVNDRIQITGAIDKVIRANTRETGTVFSISGRDVLGPVVSASIDPKVRITSNQTVSDFLIAVLSPFGAFGSKIYIGDDLNFSIVTGYLRGQGGVQVKTYESRELSSRALRPDGKSADLIFKNTKVTEVISRDRLDLKKIPLDQLKPKIGDGAMQVINRLLHRLGLRMWAAADGSGVVVDEPEYGREPIHRLTRRLGDPTNNVINGAVEVNGDQPACVVAVGRSHGSDMSKVKLKAIAVNELVSVNADGTFDQMVLDMIASYPGIKVLPIRKELLPATDALTSKRVLGPMMVKDDDSKNQAQLEAFARRTLAEKQRDFLVATYTVTGHEFNGHPWAVNSSVAVDDDYLNIHETLWVLSRTFTKSRAGTSTELKLIKPYTLQLSA